MNYLFSIIIPTFKRPEKLSTALNSLLQQKKINKTFEVIIINDGSTDGYEPSNFDASLNINYFVNERNMGVAASRNRAANLAAGKWLVFLDDDDQMEENYLSILMKHIEENPLNQCFWSGVEIRKPLAEKSERRLYTSKDKTPTQILKQFLSIGMSFGVAIRKDFFLEIGMFDIDLKVGEDTDLFLRAIEYGVDPYPIESIGIIKNEEHNDRLAFNHHLYSDLDINEKIFERHHLTLCKYKKIYSDLLFWAYGVHLSNGNIHKGKKFFDQIVSMGYPSSHILHCHSEGIELSEEYLCLDIAPESTRTF